jgi:phenylpropionate dioxygenase-like ring-hydroxylating dioxygenase large terminal subunit
MSKPLTVDWPESETPLYEAWHVLCLGRDLTVRPMQRTLLGLPIVLYRTPAGPRAFVDRCPHRGVPLSAGRCDSRGNLECQYHGWRFDSEGRLLEVPGRVAQGDRSHGLLRLPLREESGLVFVCPKPDGRPEFAPYAPPALGRPSYTTVVREITAPGSLYSTAENALDVPHTSVLHRGLFRTAGAKARITATVRRRRHWVETEYTGEPPPRGLVARLLAVGKDKDRAAVQHWDRFFLPGIAEVEYRLGPRSHFVVSAYLTPEAPELTRLYAVVSFRTPLPGRLLALVLEPFARMIFRQDQRILALQSEHVRRFGPAPFVSTELDTMGPHIRRLMKTAYQLEQTTASSPAPSTAQEIRLSASDATPPVFETVVELDA